MKKSSLCPEAQAFLDGITARLKEQKITTSLDTEALQLIGATYHNYITATKRLQEDGLFIKSSKGDLKTHPAVKVQLDSQIQLNKMMDAFLLSPKARKETVTPKEKSKEESDISKFLKKKKVNAEVQDN